MELLAVRVQDSVRSCVVQSTIHEYKKLHTALNRGYTISLAICHDASYQFKYISQVHFGEFKPKIDCNSKFFFFFF